MEQFLSLTQNRFNGRFFCDTPLDRAPFDRLADESPILAGMTTAISRRHRFGDMKKRDTTLAAVDTFVELPINIIVYSP
ncbi:MAG: hypothetical protein GY845_15090 [Planctomycetes bacterium]|nr:hypothetical protein [Planctomycetota bacterium]